METLPATCKQLNKEISMHVNTSLHRWKIDQKRYISKWYKWSGKFQECSSDNESNLRIKNEW